MKAMVRQRSHSIAFKRLVAQEFIAGETLYGLSKRHDISRRLADVRFTPKADMELSLEMSALCQTRTFRATLFALLFDHLVGAG
jgi:transposase